MTFRPTSQTDVNDAIDMPAGGLAVDALGGEEFHDLVVLAARLADASVAWLVLRESGTRSRVAARFGVDAGLDALLLSACASVDSDVPRLTVADAHEDPCFVSEPLVTRHPGVRFLHAQALLGENGQHIGTLAVADPAPRDACGRELLQALGRLAVVGERLFERHVLQRRNRIATQIMQAGFSALVVTDEHGAVTLANRAAETIFGLRERSMRGMPLDLLFPTQLQDDARGAHAWLHGDDLDGLDRGTQYRLRTNGPGGDLRTVEATRCTWRLGGGQGKAIILRDITDDLAQQATLRQIALYDALTGLPNRSALVEALTARIEATSTPLALALLGLDNFKTINDTLGHAAGDAVLQTTASRLRRVLPGHAVVGRFGGDEFGIVFADTDEATLAAQLDRLLAAVNEPLEAGGTPIHLEASIGLALRDDAARSDDDLSSASELIARADLALYKAKARGGRQWCRYDLGMRREVVERRMLEIELRRAHARGEFELHYQPQIDLTTGLTFGAEALLRWRHPERGLLSPAVFLDVLAGSALANDVGTWIIRQACRDAATWPEVDGRAIAISINLFPGQVHETDLGKDVDDALMATGLPAERVELEITETIALNPGDNASRALAALRDRGVKLSFDDFGTGFASLSMLQRFPIDRVKIDRSFVRDMLDNNGDAAIVKSIVLISRNMELHVTAEGVENREQAELLRGLGCNAAQGFLYAPALSPEAFAEWLAAQTETPAQAPWLQEPQDG